MKKRAPVICNTTSSGPLLLKRNERIKCVYKVTAPDHRCYIGQTSNLYRRLVSHRNGASRDIIKLQESIDKYGWDAHRVDIMKICETQEDLDFFEDHYIITHQANRGGLNSFYGGKGAKHTKESRQKISESNRRRVITAETRAKMSRSRKNRPPVSEETRLKMSLARKGKPSPLKGRKQSKEHTEKVRRTKLNKKLKNEGILD